MRTINLLIALLFFIPTIGAAQNIIESQPKPYRSPDSTLYWNKELPFYIKIMPTPEDSGYMLYSEEHEQYTNPTYFDTEGQNLIRTRFAVDKATHKTVVPQIEVLWEVYADGVAPETQSEFKQAPRVTIDNHTFFGKNLSVGITAEDELAGVETTYYSVNEAPYQNYSQPIAFDTEGRHALKYYSADNVGNSETPNERTFTVDLTPPITFYNITGISDNNILSSASVVYLTANDSLSGVEQIFYRIDEGEYQPYNGKNVPIKQLNDGDHTLYYYSTDKVENKEAEQTFSFYLDKVAPILAADILGDRFIVDDEVYFSGRTKLKLTAVDNKSGVKEVMFSIDNEDYNIYAQPFYLPSVPGWHVVRYYALDNTENQTSSESQHNSPYEFRHNVSKVYVDLTGPDMDFGYEGEHLLARDTMFITSDTRVKLTASDSESGLQYISYSLDKQLEELTYNEPFTIAGEGFHTIEYFSYDNVNNRNKSQFSFVVDNSPPAIGYSFSIEPIGENEGLPVYPPYVMLYPSATDKIIGTDNIYYSINGATEQRFSRYITGFAKQQINTLTIRAEDKLGNESSIEVQFYVE